MAAGVLALQWFKGRKETASREQLGRGCDLPRDRYRFFLALFLGDFLAGFFLGAAFLAPFAVVLRLPPVELPKIRSQLSENFGVGPVRTIGPPIITSARMLNQENTWLIGVADL
jgi:hypothetical protein